MLFREIAALLILNQWYIYFNIIKKYLETIIIPYNSFKYLLISLEFKENIYETNLIQ